MAALGDEEESALWEVVDNGTLPGDRQWFVIEISGVEKTRSGKTSSWWEGGVDDEGTEVPETLYVEVDPARAETKAKLQTIIPSDFELVEGGPDHVEPIYFYEGTTNVKKTIKAARIATLSPTVSVLDATVRNILHKWRQAPFASGERHYVSNDMRTQTIDVFARQIFDIPSGFYGVEP